MDLEEYTYVNGKKMRRGYTTGTCATAAAVAAIRMILNQEEEDKVHVKTASGVELTLDVVERSFSELEATAAIVKDGGDDADATHGMLIYTTVTLLPEQTEIIIDGGRGIGRVTQKGLANPIGMAAINPTPRRMIEQSVRELIGENCGAKVIVWAPEGEDRALLTYNPRLGIVGGISILGTTGIVNPMSEDSWKAAITIELTMRYDQGYRSVVLAPGNIGEDFAVNTLGIAKHRIVNMSNFIGHVLKEVQRIGFTKVLIVGHLGKLVKVAGGIFSTHSKDADARMEILVANLALMGAPLALLQQINGCLTTESAGELIEQQGYEQIYTIIADKIKLRSEKLLKYRQPQVEVDVALFSSEKYLASTKTIEELKEEWT